MDNFFNENNFKIWSKIGSRATFGLAALQLAKINENLIVVTSDVSTSAGLDRFRNHLQINTLMLGLLNKI